MKQRRFWGLLIGSLFFYSACYNSENSEAGRVKNIYVDLTKIENEKPLNEYIDQVDFIRLETTDSSLIRIISNLRVADRKIYIFDGSQGCIFVFDEKGKYLFKIDRLGRGPDEYSRILAFGIDQQNVIILGLSELVLYNKDNGDFVKKIRITQKDFLPVEFQVDSSFYYFQTADGLPTNKIQTTIVVYDKEEFTLQKGYTDPFYFKERPHVTSTVFIDSPYGVLFHQVLNDTLYRLGEKGLEPLFFLNMGQNQFTYQRYEETPVDSKGKKVIPYKAVYPIDEIVFTDKYLYFTCYQKTRDAVKYDVFWCFYRLDTGELKVFDENKLKEKSKYGTNVFDFDTVDKDGYFYVVCYPSILTYFRDKRGDQLDERYKEMQPEDNPWLMKYRLKL